MARGSVRQTLAATQGSTWPTWRRKVSGGIGGEEEQVDQWQPVKEEIGRKDRAEIDFWLRFRDDCLGLVRGTQADFKIFVDTMNSVDPDIQFTSVIDFDKNTVSFLDVQITINEDGYLITDLYEKPNTHNQLLKPTSAHPSSVTSGSVYSLAIRLRRICSTEELFEHRVGLLKDKLRERETTLTR